MPETLSDAACENPAVARCIHAHSLAYEKVMGAKKDRIAARVAANEAYCKAMPPLDGFDNIRGFVACLAYGMLINVIHPDQGTKLLYAAQVAQTSTRKSPGKSEQTTK